MTSNTNPLSEGYHGFQASERLRRVESRERIMAYSADPTGVVTAGATTLLVDYTNWDLYVNDTGAPGIGTSWQLVGGGGGAVPHNLLNGVVHPDTAVDAVTRGSLIYGNSTPLWDELVHPGTDYTLQTDANDVLWRLTPNFPAGFDMVGASTVNTITVPDNIANAMDIVDDDSVGAGSPTYFQIVSSDANERVYIFPNTATGVDMLVGTTTTVTSALLTVAQSIGIRGDATIPSPNLRFRANGGTVWYLENDNTSINMVRVGTGVNDFTVVAGSFIGRQTTISGNEYWRCHYNTASYYFGNGNFGFGTTTPDRDVHIEASTAITNTVDDLFRLTHITSGTPAAGFGIGFEWELESTTTNRIAATDEALWQTATDASRSAIRRFEVVSNANDWEFLRLSGSNSQAETVFNENAADIDFRVDTSSDNYALFVEGSSGYVGVGSSLPGTKLHTTEKITLTGNIGDGYAASIRQTPSYDGAFTVTRHNYIDMNDVTLGTASLTNSAIIRFDAAFGTHSATTSSFNTTDSNGDTTAWAGGIIVNVNGTLYKLPAIAV